MRFIFFFVWVDWIFGVFILDELWFSYLEREFIGIFVLLLVIVCFGVDVFFNVRGLCLIWVEVFVNMYLVLVVILVVLEINLKFGVISLLVVRNEEYNEGIVEVSLLDICVLICLWIEDLVVDL